MRSIINGWQFFLSIKIIPTNLAFELIIQKNFRSQTSLVGLIWFAYNVLIKNYANDAWMCGNHGNLTVNCSIIFSSLKMFFTCYVWYSSKLLQLYPEGKTIFTENLTKKLRNWNQNSR